MIWSLRTPPITSRDMYIWRLAETGIDSRIADILPRQSSMGTKYIRQRWYQTLGHQCVLWRIDGVLGHI